jgi:hypothetical protein
MGKSRLRAPEVRILRRTLGGEREDVRHVGDNYIKMNFLIFTNC